MQGNLFPTCPDCCFAVTAGDYPMHKMTMLEMSAMMMMMMMMMMRMMMMMMRMTMTMTMMTLLLSMEKTMKTMAVRAHLTAMA